MNKVSLYEFTVLIVSDKDERTTLSKEAYRKTEEKRPL